MIGKRLLLTVIKQTGISKCLLLVTSITATEIIHPSSHRSTPPQPQNNVSKTRTNFATPQISCVPLLHNLDYIVRHMDVDLIGGVT